MNPKLLAHLLTHTKSAVFTNIAPSLALSSLPTLGSLQQCGELLRRERKDDSTLGVFPRVCALYQSLQGEDPRAGAASCVSPHVCADELQLSLLVGWEVPWFVSEQSGAEPWLPLCHRTWRIVRGQITGKASWF